MSTREFAEESSREEDKFVLLDLPHELLEAIFSKLCASDLVRLGTACKALQRHVADAALDRRLWRDKLPDACNDALLHDSQPGAGERVRVARGGNTYPSTLRELSCAVYAFTATVTFTEVASVEDALEAAASCWDSGRVLHADVLLALACHRWPSLRTFAAHASLLFHELCSLERTAHALSRAAQYIEAEELVGRLRRATPPWRAGIQDTNSPVDDMQAQARQLASMAAILLRFEQLDYSALEAALEPKKSVLRLTPLPPAFREWLAPGAASPDQKPTGPDSPNAAPPPSASGWPSPSASSTGATTSRRLSVMGLQYRVDDLARARRRLLRPDSPLAALSDEQLLASAIGPRSLSPPVADLLEAFVTGMTAQHADMYAWFMWQEHARKHITDAFQTGANPYICKRLEVWAAVDCYLAVVTLLKAKKKNNYKLLHAVGASAFVGLSDNVQTACLAELTLELTQMGWVDAAKHCCVWAMVENENGMCQDVARCRYELAGTLVDILTQTLERSRSATDEAVATAVRDALTWTLATAKLMLGGPAALIHFVQRLSKVLHCCVLRLPDTQQRETCARASLALCRLGLALYRGPHKQPVDELPVPRVDLSPLSTSTQRGDAGRTRLRPQPFARLAAWHESEPAECSELVAELQDDDLHDVLHPDSAPDEPKSKKGFWTHGLPWSTSIRRWIPYVGVKAEPSDAGGGARRKRAFPQLCTWIGELLYADEECAVDETWADYERDLEQLLGLEDGMAAFRGVIAPVDMDIHHQMMHWESICHLYEHMAHICTAMARTSLAALFYGLCARAIMNVPPSQQMMMHADFGADVDASPTASKFLADVLSQQATELTAACELPAAMRTLHFCEVLCTQVLKQMKRRASTKAEEIQGVNATLARVKSQMGSIIMELHNRHGVSELSIPKLVVHLGPYVRAEVHGWLHIDVSYEAARALVVEALSLTRHNHMDGHLQALFILGDVALVRYDLAEARRLFSIVARGAAHTLVQHFNLMLQAHAFRAVTEMHMGDSRASRKLIQHCMTMFGLDADTLAVYDREGDQQLGLFAETVRRLHEQGAATSNPQAATRGDEDDPQSSVRPSDSPPDDGNAPGPSTSSRGPGSRPSRSQHAKRKEPKFQLEYETLSPERVNELSQDELLIRLMAAAWQHGMHPAACLDSIMTRAWEIQMQDAPEGQEEQFVDRTRQAWLEQHPVEQFTQAIRDMVLQLSEVPTQASAQLWSQTAFQGTFANMLLGLGIVVRNGPPPLEEDQDEWEEVSTADEAEMIERVSELQMAGSSSDDDDASDSGAGDTGAAFDELWDFFEAAEQPGVSPLPSANGALTPPANDGAVAEAGDTLLADPSRTELDEASSAPHTHMTISEEMLDCEDAEWSAIQGFMNQVGLQIHLMHGRPGRASAEAVRSMRVKAVDQHSHVHIWYWSGAIAQHSRVWTCAYHFFRRAARCTHSHLHLSMQAKSLAGCCEVALGYFVHTHFPALTNNAFAAELLRSGTPPRGALALHAQLCRAMLATVSALPADLERPAPTVWPREIAFVRAALSRALDNAGKTNDNGVELRALLIAQFVLKMDGALAYTADGDVVAAESRVDWLPSCPSLGAIEHRVNELLVRLQRNVLVIRRLMSCNVAFDARAVQQMVADLRERGHDFSQLGM